MKLNSLHLKIIALVLMFTEHFGKYLGELLPPNAPQYLRYAGRIVLPIFFFLVVESYFKTRDRRRYIIRLYLWAFIMQVGNFLVSKIVETAYQPEDFFEIGQNIFLSIALGVSMIAAIEWGRAQIGYKKWVGFILGGLFALASPLGEADHTGLALFLVFYFFYNRKPALYFAYVGLCFLFFVKAVLRMDFFDHEYEWMKIAALPFIMLYNGERGPYGLKYLFYAFYPLHIWILYFIRFATGLNKL
ncbi:MAG: hypothetical protein HY865_20810 [Chloroflexi bacterium]|nr:hypothetical protein [Chloroflexota bacterium]